MAFRVEIEPQAFDDLDQLTDHIKAGSSFETAQKWFNSMMRSIASLSAMPERCAVAPEAEELGYEVRLLLHGRRNRTYKIYFDIRHDSPTDGVVRVFHIRHWARRPMSNHEFEQFHDDKGEA